MSGVKHTPGPWDWDNGLLPPDGPERFADIYTVGGDIVIASFNEAIPEGEANARLIAAAPDHHAVALELDRLALVIDSAVRFADPAFKDEVQALLKANKAALARARGEQDGGGE